MGGNYILKDGEPVKVEDILEWGRWFETADRTVITTFIGDLRASTVFLGIDHQFGIGPPLLYETMVFDGDSCDDLECERYSTLAQAKAGHEAICERLRTKAP